MSESLGGHGADRDRLVADLLRVLELEEVGEATTSLKPKDGRAPADFPSMGSESVAVFLGQSQKMPHNRVFGGQVLAQSVIAAGRTIEPAPGAPPRPIHSLHAYFVRPGDDTMPIQFAVERMRDGGSFSARRVHAIQHGVPILAMSASFQEPADGLEHMDEMPDVPPPEILAWRAATADALLPQEAFRRRRPFEIRTVEGDFRSGDDPQPHALQNMWMRFLGKLPDDPLLHAAILAYSSDYSLLEPVLRTHGIHWTDQRLRVASLDHSMWFHRPARADQWYLYNARSPSAQGGRGLGIGRMFTEDGRLVATVAQEGMVRIKQS